MPDMNIASTNTATNTAAAAIMLTNNDDDGATILDDGLSTCDEDNNFNENSRNRTLTTSADAARQISEAKRYHWFTCSLLFITFFISVLISSVRIYVFPRQEQLVLGMISLVMDWKRKRMHCDLIKLWNI
jgi:hypothetical protein